jgi:hypothetical protein
MAKERYSEAKAYRTMIGLKEQGYSFNSAIGDIIDNCISPKVESSEIKIIFDKTYAGEFFVRIFDNGIGMDSETLFEAMRYGSGEEEQYDKDDLGKFGMGMKTASTSQARTLTVLSKSKKNSKVTGFIWDLDYVKKTKKWSILELDKLEIENFLKKENKVFEEHYKIDLIKHTKELKSWTMVCWDNMEILNRDYKKFNTAKSAENFYDKLTSGLTLYLRRTFSRFIEGKMTRKISLNFNGYELTYWDPFCRSEPHTIEDPLKKDFSEFVITDGVINYDPIFIKRYILPAKEGQYSFTSNAAWRDSFGSEGANDSQGYYIYRNNRLVDFGGWKRIRKKDEHLKLARVCIDITDNHDRLFQLDVKKTRVIFPTELSEHLSENINQGYHKRAIDRYNSSNKRQPIQNSFRNKSNKLVHVSNELIIEGKVKISEDNKKNKITVENKYGKITTDSIYKNLDRDLQIQSKPFGNKNDLWLIEPHPSKGFILVLNEDHLFYSKIYKEASTIKTLSALADAFLFTFSFVELRCKSNENEELFNDIRLVAAEVLNKFINEKLI